MFIIYFCPPVRVWRVQGYGLIDISLLSSYPHLQRLVLASNNLTGTYMYLYITHPPIHYSQENKQHFLISKSK
jgi:hypothetical protein